MARPRKKPANKNVDAVKVDAPVDAVKVDAVKVDAVKVDAVKVDAPVDAAKVDAPVDAVKVDAVKVDAPVDAAKVDAPAQVKKEEEKKDEKKEEVAQSSTLYNVGTTVAGVSVGAAGFWFSGLYPSTISLLANYGLSLTAASVGVQIGVSLVAGAMIAGFAYGLYRGVSWMLGSSKEETVDTRNEDQKYHDDLKTTDEELKKVEPDFVKELDKILDVEHTAERKFVDGKKAPADTQLVADDTLIVKQYELKLAKELAAVKPEEKAAKQKTLLEAATEAKNKHNFAI